MNNIIGGILIGFALGIISAIFTGVEDSQLLDHGIAHYDSQSGALIWNDTNTSVH